MGGKDIYVMRPEREKTELEKTAFSSNYSSDAQIPPRSPSGVL